MQSGEPHAERQTATGCKAANRYGRVQTCKAANRYEWVQSGRLLYNYKHAERQTATDGQPLRMDAKRQTATDEYKHA